MESPTDRLNPAASRTSPEEVEKTFASLLGQAAVRTRVVLLLDALNQFEPSIRARHLTWLPKLWPENARLIATAIPGAESAALADRAGVSVRAVPAMETEEARAVAGRYFRERYHREPNARALDALLARPLPDGRPAAGNPLWLELALQELNLLEADDYARAEREFPDLDGGARMEALQVRAAESLPPEPAGVYRNLLGRAERDFGADRTRALLNAIALSRAGWRESDLRVLVPAFCGGPWDNVAFAGVRRALGPHLVQRGARGEWDAFHGQLRQCVFERQLTAVAEQRRLHGLIADHLLRLPAEDPLRRGETMVHLIGLGDTARAARYLAGLSSGAPALAAAASVLAQHAAKSAEGLRFLTALPSGRGLADQEIQGCVNHLQFEGLAALERETGLDSQRQLIEACRKALERLAQSDPSNAGWQRDLVVSNYKLAGIAAQAEDPETQARHLQGCRRILQAMQAAGTYLDAPLTALLEQLEEGVAMATPVGGGYVQPEVAEPAKRVPVDTAPILAAARKLIEANQCAEALSLLQRQATPDDRLRNAAAVCQLRLGAFAEAVDLLREVLIIPGTIRMRPDAPAHLITNFATALLGMNNVEGCQGKLNELSETDHPDVQRLRACIRTWEAGTGFTEKLKWKLGIRPDRPVTLDFVPGDLGPVDEAD